MKKVLWALIFFLFAAPVAYGAEYVDYFSRQKQVVPINFPAYLLVACNLPYEVFDTHVAPSCSDLSVSEEEKQEPFVKMLHRCVHRNWKVKLRDAKNKKLLHTFNGWRNDHTIKVSVDLADGTTASYGSRQPVLNDHEGEVNSVALLANEEKKEFLRALDNVHRAWVKSVAFSADRTKIVSGSCRGVIKVWNAVTGQVLETLHVRKGSIKDLWLKDGTVVSRSSSSCNRSSDSARHIIRQWHLPGIEWAKNNMTLPQYGLIKAITEFSEMCKQKEKPLSLSVLAWRLLGLDNASVEDKDVATTEVAALFNSIPTEPREYLVKKNNMLPVCLSAEAEPRALCVVGEAEIKKKRKRCCIVS